MINDAKVLAAAFVGSLPVATTLFLDKAEPIFRMCALAGQVAVASVTVVYIITKIRSVIKNKKDDQSL